MKAGMIEIDGTRLQDLRKKQKYSLENLANICGSSKQELSSIENGKTTTIHKSKFYKLKKYLNCSSEYLQGLVQNIDEVIVEFSENDTPLRTVKAAVKFDSYADKIYSEIIDLPDEYLFRLEKFVKAYFTLDDPHRTLLEEIADSIIATSKRYSKVTYENNPYIYNYLLEHTIPAIEAKAKKIIFSPSLSDSFESFNMDDDNTKYYIHSQLGVFQKETNHYLESTLKTIAKSRRSSKSNVIVQSILEDAIDSFLNQLRKQLRKTLLYNSDFYSSNLQQDARHHTEFLFDAIRIMNNITKPCLKEIQKQLGNILEQKYSDNSNNQSSPPQ